MKNTCLLKLLPAVFLMFLGLKTGHAQARNGVGFMYGFNKPFSGHYSSGPGFKLIGSIALTPKFALMPYVGYENLKGDGSPVFEQTDHGGYRDGTVQNTDVLKVGADANYYLNRYLFAQAGAMAYAASGNEDLINLGIGGSAAVGVSLPVEEHLHFDFSGYTELIYLGYGGGIGLVPYAGLRAAIFFAFGKPIFK